MIFFFLTNDYRRRKHIEVENKSVKNNSDDFSFSLLLSVNSAYKKENNDLKNKTEVKKKMKKKLELPQKKKIFQTSFIIHSFFFLFVCLFSVSHKNFIT